MSPTKYQVFISSTYSDLKDEREEIIKAILELYHIPIGMEMFSAEDEDQWEIIRRTIDVSDYYILVLGLRYGSKTSDGISFTQKEYEYALQIKIPILAFIMDEAVALPKGRRDDNLTEVQNFRSTVLENSKMAQFWKTKDELIRNVSISLTKQIAQKPGIGWVRGDKLGNEEALSRELASLSKENRQLREKVVELESAIVQKLPDIVVHIDLPKIDDNFDSHKKLTIPDPIDFDAIKDYLKQYITKEEINTYNQKIECQNDIDRYNAEAELAYKIKNYSIPLVVTVGNQGSLKANNVFIDIKFPDELFVYDAEEEFNEPKNPLPNNPLIMAQKKYEKEQKNNIYKNIFSENFLSLNDVHHQREILAVGGNIFRAPKIIPVHQEWRVSLNKNELAIKINDLLHTRQRKLSNGYKIAAIKSGKYKIIINIICEEYISNKEQIIEVTI